MVSGQRLAWSTFLRLRRLASLGVARWQGGVRWRWCNGILWMLLAWAAHCASSAGCREQLLAGWTTNSYVSDPYCRTRLWGLQQTLRYWHYRGSSFQGNCAALTCTLGLLVPLVGLWSIACNGEARLSREFNTELSLINLSILAGAGLTTGRHETIGDATFADPFACTFHSTYLLVRAKAEL